MNWHFLINHPMKRTKKCKECSSVVLIDPFVWVSQTSPIQQHLLDKKKVYAFNRSCLTGAYSCFYCKWLVICFQRCAITASVCPTSGRYFETYIFSWLVSFVIDICFVFCGGWIVTSNRLMSSFMYNKITSGTP